MNLSLQFPRNNQTNSGSFSLNNFSTPVLICFVPLIILFYFLKSLPSKVHLILISPYRHPESAHRYIQNTKDSETPHKIYFVSWQTESTVPSWSVFSHRDFQSGVQMRRNYHKLCIKRKSFLQTDRNSFFVLVQPTCSNCLCLEQLLK